MNFFIMHWEVISSVAMFILSEVIGVLPVKSSGIGSLAVNTVKKAFGKESPKDAVETVKDETLEILKGKITAESKRFETKVNNELGRAIDRMFKK
jgi:hypothetical protein